MRKKFWALFVLFVMAAALVVSSACEMLKGNSPTSPGPRVLDMTKPFDVVDTSSTPPDGATLRLGSFWEIRFTVWCEDGWWGLYFIRDDGVTAIYQNTSGCVGRNRGGTNGILNEDDVLYKLGRGHKVSVRMAKAPDSTLLRNGLNLIVSDADIVTWFIE